MRGDLTSRWSWANARSRTRPWRYSRCRRWCWSRRRPRLHAVPSACTQRAVRVVISTPDDHFTPRPYCRVITSTNGCVNNAGRCPTICAQIVPAACVEMATDASKPPQVIISLPVQTAVCPSSALCCWLLQCCLLGDSRFTLAPIDFPGSTDPWAHGHRPSTPAMFTVVVVT